MNVQDRVRQLLDNTDLSDPHAIAEKILGEMKGAKAREALAECLPHYVRLIIGKDRSSFAADRLDPAREATDAQSSSAGSSRSARWEAAGRVFRRREFVNGRWDQLGNLTVDEVTWLAEDRYRKAKDLTSKGDEYAALRDRMVSRGAMRVRDMPEADVGEILS